MAISESDFEQLSQLLDGELDAAARARMEQRIAREPELAGTWERLQTVNLRLQRAYAGREAAGVPSEIRALLKDREPGSGTDGGKVVPLFGQRRQLWPAALAASVVLAVAVALFPGGESTSPRQAGMTLAEALESSASGDDWRVLTDGSRMQAVLTFPRHGGGWCREYLLHEAGGDAPLRGVACRTAGDWQTEVLAQGSGPESRDVYRPAGAADSNAVHEFIRDHAADIPLDASKENALIIREWR